MMRDEVDQKGNSNSKGNIHRSGVANSCIYLEFQWWRAILFGAPVILSIVGIYFLIKYAQLRCRVFYSSSSKISEGSTTHVLLESKEKTKVILPIHDDIYKNQKHFYCELEHEKILLKDDDSFIYVDLSQQQIGLQINRGLLSIENGLEILEVRQRQRYYGKNEHKLQPPNYFYYMFSVLTEPIFLLQYLIQIIWILYGYQFLFACQFLISFIVVTFNYFILKNNFHDIREIAEHHGKTRVIRQGQKIEIENSDIVVGDLFYLDAQIPCDSVILRGEATVSQANLTGQSIPVWKIQQDPQKIQKNIQWIYEGSQVISSKKDTIAIALRVGFSSRKGSMLKQILGQQTQQPQFFKKIIIFFVLNFLISLVVFEVITNFIIQEDQTKKLVSQNFFLFITYCFPTSLTTMSAFAASMAIIRMKRNNIIGKDIGKCFDGSQIKTIYFDKTGTLTESNINLAQIYRLNEQKQLVKLQNILSNSLFSKLFSSCHSITSRKGELIGDQIDLQMFKATSCIIKLETKQQVKTIIEGNDCSIQVLKLFQFQSKNQSMTVIVKTYPQEEYFVFSKGSPELIKKYSTNEVKGFNNLLKKMSLEGFRSIAFGYRQFYPDDLANELQKDQQELIQNTTFLGFASFSNKIKVEAKDVVSRLKEQVGIEQKILTGDNIYVAVQAAYRTGILNDNQTCLICQEQDKKVEQIKLTFIQKIETKFVERQIIISQSQIKAYLTENQPKLRTLAMDYEFYNQYSFCPEDNIRIFSRVKPEGKAQIIKAHMSSLELKQLEKSILNRLLSDYRYNICMVGDGANDLLAIKESDVGISVQAGLGSARADFTITNLNQIEEIIKEGKNVTQIFMEYSQIISLILLLNTPTFFELIKEHSTISISVTVFRSFYYFGVLHIVFPLSIPSCNTHRVPNTNTLKSYFQLKFWGSYLLSAFATILCFELYFDIEGIHPSSQGNDRNTQLSHYDFFLQNIKSLFVLITNYKSHPWKQPIFNNYYLLTVIIVNSLFIIIGLFSGFSIASLHFFHISNIVKIGLLMIFSLFGFLIVMWIKFLDYLYQDSLEQTSLVYDS